MRFWEFCNWKQSQEFFTQNISQFLCINWVLTNITKLLNNFDDCNFLVLWEKNTRADSSFFRGMNECFSSEKIVLFLMNNITENMIIDSKNSLELYSFHSNEPSESFSNIRGYLVLCKILHQFRHLWFQIRNLTDNFNSKFYIWLLTARKTQDK